MHGTCMCMERLTSLVRSLLTGIGGGGPSPRKHEQKMEKSFSSTRRASKKGIYRGLYLQVTEHQTPPNQDLSQIQGPSLCRIQFPKCKSCAKKLETHRISAVGDISIIVLYFQGTKLCLPTKIVPKIFFQQKSAVANFEICSSLASLEKLFCTSKIKCYSGSKLRGGQRKLVQPDLPTLYSGSSEGGHHR